MAARPEDVFANAASRLEALHFDSSYARLPESFYSRPLPAPFPNPYLVSFNTAAGGLIDLAPGEERREGFLHYFSGAAPIPGSEPLAMLYSGHQFGAYKPQLGDGRALLLGQVRNSRGESWDLHAKGTGPTVYSRGEDGRAVLRSTIREYLCSEAMHALDIPTTRALCVIGSDMPVYREEVETAALLVRMATSHVRFGHFEVFFYRGEWDALKQLADYVIEQNHPELRGENDKYLQLYRAVVERTAELIAQWQAVGFVHGVMNTDNMSILGLTFDYGPFGFMEDYDKGFVCNASDKRGRYAFDRQPGIARWNLAALAQAMLPLFSDDAEQSAELARLELDAFMPAFEQSYIDRMRRKLGLREARDNDADLVARLRELMTASRADYTIAFRDLGGFRIGGQNQRLRDSFADREAFDAWAADYGARLAQEGSEDTARKRRMNRVNPKYILRNYLAQNAITMATQAKDFGEIDRLLKLLQRPFGEQPQFQSYAAPSPDWGKRLEISCSS